MKTTLKSPIHDKLAGVDLLPMPSGRLAMSTGDVMYSLYSGGVILLEQKRRRKKGKAAVFLLSSFDAFAVKLPRKREGGRNVLIRRMTAAQAMESDAVFGLNQDALARLLLNAGVISGDDMAAWALWRRNYSDRDHRENRAKRVASCLAEAGISMPRRLKADLKRYVDTPATIQNA